VTDRGTNSIVAFAVGPDGYLGEAAVHPSSGATPYGFDFTSDSVLVVTETFGGEVGAASASSYGLRGGELVTISGSVPNTRSEVCWAVVSHEDRYAFVTNFGDGTISSYRIAQNGQIELQAAIAATTVLGAAGVRDEALTPDGRFLYALDADARTIFGWSVGDGGSLSPLGGVDGLPATAAGLAAR
jgi:6-phosphogluconolactonase